MVLLRRDSSAVERLAVNQFVLGSIPSRAAIYSLGDVMIKYLGVLDSLGLPKNKCLLFGSAVMAAHGLGSNNDLDVAVPLSVFSTLAKNPKLKKSYANTSGTISYVTRDGKVEIFPSAWPLKENMAVLLQRADNIDGYKIMHLTDFKRWKKAMGRPKDIQDLKLL